MGGSAPASGGYRDHSANIHSSLTTPPRRDPRLRATRRSNPMNQSQVAAYLYRIGVGCALPANIDSLRTMQERHLLAVPFENLSIHLGEPIDLDYGRAVRQNRRAPEGRLLLRTERRVRGAALRAGLPGHPACRPRAGQERARATLRPPRPARRSGRTLAGRRRLRRVQHLPIAARRPRGDQPDPAGTFRIDERDTGDLDVRSNGELQYRLEMRPRVLSDFEPTCWWHQTSPKSHFTWSPVCSLPIDGRPYHAQRPSVDRDA